LAAAGIASKRPHSSCHVLLAERRAPQKDLLQQMRDGDINMSTPVVEPTQASTPQSCNKGVRKKSTSIGAPNWTPPSGKRKLKALRQGDVSDTGGTDALASNSQHFGAEVADPSEPNGEEVRAFAGHIQSLYTQMLNSPLCKRAQGVQWHAYGHDSLQRQEQIPSRGLEEKAQPKKSKVSASANVLKERFQKPAPSSASPAKKTKENKIAGESNKKTKKKKV
jgi:hypothetical protein